MKITEMQKSKFARKSVLFNKYGLKYNKYYLK